MLSAVPRHRFRFPDALIREPPPAQLVVGGSFLASLGTCLQFVAFAPNLPCFLPFQEVVGSMWTVRLSLPAFVDSPHCAFPFGEAVFTASLVGSSGLEPPTSRLSGVRSNHLSYEPISLVPRRLVPRPLFPLLPFSFRFLRGAYLAVRSHFSAYRLQRSWWR